VTAAATLYEPPDPLPDVRLGGGVGPSAASFPSRADSGPGIRYR
jgi:hypothetical protein